MRCVEHEALFYYGVTYAVCHATYTLYVSDMAQKGNVTCTVQTLNWIINKRSNSLQRPGPATQRKASDLIDILRLIVMYNYC